MDLSFIIPVFNEEKSLNELNQEIINNVRDYSYEIIFVNDGSSDNSGQLLENLAQKDSNIKIIHFRKNFGKSSALQAGFEQAEGNIVFTMDADLQDDPAEIPNFIDKINEGYDLVAGWKKNEKTR